MGRKRTDTDARQAERDATASAPAGLLHGATVAAPPPFIAGIAPAPVPSLGSTGGTSFYDKYKSLIDTLPADVQASLAKPPGPPAPSLALSSSLAGLAGASPKGTPAVVPSTLGLSTTLLPGPGLASLPIGIGCGDVTPPVLDTESLAQMRYQQVAAQYDAIKTKEVNPQVQAFCEYHSLDERVMRHLDEELKNRPDTFENDMESLWIGVEGSKNPAGLVMMKVKDMKNGTFRSLSVLDKKVRDYAKKNRLDAQAGMRLAEVLESREDADGDLEKLARHLERSKHPSSLLMMMLRDLREGKPIKEAQYSAAVGSRLHDKELKEIKELKKRSRSRKDRGGKDEARGGRHDKGSRRSRSRGREQLLKAFR